MKPGGEIVVCDAAVPRGVATQSVVLDWDTENRDALVLSRDARGDRADVTSASVEAH